MCGRFAFYSPSEAVTTLFNVSFVADIQPRYNIAPTQYIAAIRRDDQQNPEVAMLRWGLVPFWAKDPSIGNRMINARAETVAEKPSYRTAFRKRRCLVLADGFYEWRKGESGKTPYFISLADGEPFAFAGLWENWQDKDSDESIQSTTIITTAANDFMKGLHHRMPIVLTGQTAPRWLDGEPGLLDEIRDDSPQFRAWPVSRTVNNARNEAPELIEPAGAEHVP